MSRGTLSLIALLLAANAGGQEWAPASWRGALPRAEGVPALPPAKDAAGAPARAPRVDSFVLALSWLPEFCAGRRREECDALAPGKWEARNLSLHGLWPNQDNDPSRSFAYCGVPDEVRRLAGESGAWCRLPATGASEAALRELSTYMPGTRSCLHTYEWTKHGTCSGFSAGEYFERSAALTATFAATAPGRFITENVGKTVAAEDLLRAFDDEFGAGGRRSATLRCSKDGGPRLAEIHVSLAAPLLGAEELGKMLRPGPRGNCPASFLIREAR